jgi:chromosome segregation ATPase
MNHLFQKFGYPQNFSPVYIFSPKVDITQSNLKILLDIKKRIEEYKTKYFEMCHDYEYTIKSHENLVRMLTEAQNKNNVLIKTLEEGNKIGNELKNSIEKYTKQIEEINPLLNTNKETINNLNTELNKKSNVSQQLAEKIGENNSVLNKLKERIVPNPENFNQIIEQNKQLLNDLNSQQNILQKDLDVLYKNNETFLKVNEKLLNLKTNVEEYHDYDIKNKQIYKQKEQIQNEIRALEEEALEYKEKYQKHEEILNNTELLMKNQQKEFNSLKSNLSSQIKEYEKIKNNLKITLDHTTNQILIYKSEIDKINYERNELQNLRDEYAQILGRKLQDIIQKQTMYYKLFDKSLELYQNYDIINNKEGK